MPEGSVDDAVRARIIELYEQEGENMRTFDNLFILALKE